ncbi:MAG: lipid-binding SYLF domain-containing protein [Candidatus Omnitrophica bacterium]|nr:lipid-binding SYLF domain-containing protein [Candidatus Omnitrophota bacterium]
MKKLFSVVTLILCFLVISTPSFAEDKWDNLLVECAKVFEEMTMMPEEGIPESLLKDSYAVAIFPSVVGGGFIVGGKYGQGIIVRKDKKANTWSAPCVFNLGGASFGWQIGGQATDTILLVMSERGLDGLLKSKLKLGGDASVAAGPLGREAEAGTDLQLKGAILSYSRSRGAFIGLKLEGSVITVNNEANTSLYGGNYTPTEILLYSKVESPVSAKRLMDDLAKY